MKYLIILFTIFTCLILGGCSTTNNNTDEISTTNAFTSNTEGIPTVVGYSYYDEYGNFLTGGSKIESIEIQKQDAKLSYLKFKTDHFNTYDQTIQVNYHNDQIVNIIIENYYSYMKTNILNSKDLSTGDNYQLTFTHNKEIKTINYEYNSNNFRQTQTIDYIVENNQNRQVILSEIQDDVFTKELIDGQTKIVYSKIKHNFFLGDDVATNFNQNTNIKLTTNSSLITEDISGFMTLFNEHLYSYDYVTEAYFDNNNNINYNHNGWSLYVKSSTNDMTEIKKFIRESNLSDQHFEHKVVKYHKNIKVYEDINHYWMPEHNRRYTYNPTIIDGSIDSIDQYENDNLVMGYDFIKENYGYQVIHYSYVKNYSGNNNMFSMRIYGPSTPLYIIRSNELYTNALLKQTLPYEYLLEK